MKTNVKKIAVLLSFMIMGALLPITVSAEQESEEVSESAAETEESETETLSPVDQVNYLISLIDEDNPKMSAVLDAKEAYDALTIAQKTRVTEYEKLYRVEIKTGVARETKAVLVENRDPADEATEKEGQKYTFRTSQYLNSVTLAIRYTVDLDKDGRMDNVDVSMVTPDGRTVIFHPEDSLIKDSCGEIHISRSSVMMQLDVVNAASGSFTVRTSLPVTFILSEYEDPEMVQFQGEENSASDSSQRESTVDPAKARNKGLIVMVVFILAVAGGFVGLKLLMNRQFGSGKKEKEKGKGPKPLTDEEEAELIRKEWANMKGAFKDEEDKPEEKQEELEDDDRLSMTMEDIASDDTIEEISEDNDGNIGIFGRPRF